MAAIKASLPTDTPVPPTPTLPPEDVVKDISDATLLIEDFPESFKPMSPSDMETVSMTPDSLAKIFTENLIKAEAHNPTGFMRQEGTQIEMVFGMVVYPLTMVEVAGFNMDLADPQAFMNNFVESSGSDARLLDGSDTIGEKSVAFDLKIKLDDPSGPDMRGQMAFSRRSNAVTMIYLLYYNTPSPSVNIIDLAKKLDGRLEAALSR